MNRWRCLVPLLCVMLTCSCLTGQIVELPQDAGKWYLSIVGDAKDPQYHQLVHWFDTNSDLRQLRQQTHYHAVTTDSPLYELYRPHTRSLPCVRLQRADGSLVYQQTGQSIPQSAKALTDSIGERISQARQAGQGVFDRMCPGGKCFRKRQPTPAPKPEPEEKSILVDPPANPIEHVGPPDTPASHGLPTAAIVGTIVAALVTGLGWQWYRDSRTY